MYVFTTKKVYKYVYIYSLVPIVQALLSLVLEGVVYNVRGYFFFLWIVCLFASPHVSTYTADEASVSSTT
jgi:hypothetical protein